MAQDLRAGTTTQVGVNTAQALAELRALALEADAVRARLAGLPPPAAGAPASTSPRLPVMPQPNLAGGKGSGVAKKASQKATEAARRAAVLSGAVPVHIPAEGPTAAQNAATAGPKQKLLAGLGASEEAQLSAWAQHKKRLAMSFEEGFKLKTEGARLGVFSVEKGGTSLASAWSRALGPAMGYFALVGAGLKVAEAGSKVLFNVIDDAAKSGRSISQVLKERVADLPREIGGAVYGALLTGLGTFADPLRNTILGAGAGIALAADRDDLARLAVLKSRVASQQVSDAIAWLRGEKTSGQVLASFQQERETAIVIAINESKRQADKDSQRVAEQLLRLGFPGTMDDLKGEVRPTLLAKNLEGVDKIRKEYDAREKALINGRQE